MTKTLIEEALKEGIKSFQVGAIIENNDQILLIEKLPVESTHPLFEFPSCLIKQNEALSQALQRGILETAGLSLSKVETYLGHYDVSDNHERYFCFIAQVDNPYAVEMQKETASAWIEPQEASGYPISDQIRDLLNLYINYRAT